jgi:hypothetical protein
MAGGASHAGELAMTRGSEDLICPTCGGLVRALYTNKEILRSYYWPLARLARELLRAWSHMDVTQQQQNTLAVHEAVHGLREFFAAHPRR